MDDRVVVGDRLINREGSHYEVVEYRDGQLAVNPAKALKLLKVNPANNGENADER